MLLLGTLLTAGVLALAGLPWQGAGQVSSITFTAVNLLCWWLLLRRLRAEGRSLRDILGRWRTVDLAWGLLWVVVLYFPFALGLIGTALLIVGGFDRFGDLFVPSASLPGGGWVWALAIVAFAFPIINAPVEELYYRGYAQGALAAAGRPCWAIWLPSLGFALQHVFVAQSLISVPAYLVAFLLWGLTAALIRRGQPDTLWPLILAHFVTNLAFSVVPLVILLTTS